MRVCVGARVRLFVLKCAQYRDAAAVLLCETSSGAGLNVFSCLESIAASGLVCLVGAMVLSTPEEHTPHHSVGRCLFGPVSAVLQTTTVVPARSAARPTTATKQTLCVSYLQRASLDPQPEKLNNTAQRNRIASADRKLRTSTPAPRRVRSCTVEVTATTATTATTAPTRRCAFEC